MDFKDSAVTAASRKQYRAVLPRQADLMQGVWQLHAESVWSMGQDAVDAYWQMLLRPQEPKFDCAVLRRPGRNPTYVPYNRTLQGSHGAPLCWTIIYALVCKMAFSTLRCQVAPSSQRMEVYVDDPACLLPGTEQGWKQQMAVMTLAWAAMVIVLAFSKVLFGKSVSWIGASFESTNIGVLAIILRARLDDLLSLVKELLFSNVAPIRKVRTGTGKEQSLALLLWTWRPFIHDVCRHLRTSGSRFGQATTSQLYLNEADTYSAELDSCLCHRSEGRSHSHAHYRPVSTPRQNGDPNDRCEPLWHRCGFSHRWTGCWTLQRTNLAFRPSHPGSSL